MNSDQIKWLEKYSLDWARYTLVCFFDIYLVADNKHQA